MAQQIVSAFSLGGIGVRKRKGEDIEVTPDRGCDLWPSCLSCPLPRCRYEMTYEELLAALEELTRPGR